MGKYIPDRVLENRSELARELLSDRYWLIRRKKILTALLLFFLLGTFGAHRFYFKKWRSGAALILVLALLVLSPLYLPFALVETDMVTTVVPILILMVLLYEFIKIFINIEKYNSELASEIKKEAGVL